MNDKIVLDADEMEQDKQYPRVINIPFRIMKPIQASPEASESEDVDV